MREIKFRGKRKHGSEWLIGDLNHIDGQVFVFPRTDDTPLNSPDWFEVDPKTVCQYVGIKDKDGKELYEGDICPIEGIPCYVQYSGFWGVKFSFKANFGSYSFTDICNHFSGRDFVCDDIEVIGNIHDNPELLK